MRIYQVGDRVAVENFQYHQYDYGTVTRVYDNPFGRHLLDVKLDDVHYDIRFQAGQVLPEEEARLVASTRWA